MKVAHMADCHIGGWRDPKLRLVNAEAFQKAVAVCIEKEVDFILRAGTKVTGLIQVCLDIDSEGARKREHNALSEASEELDCRCLTILSWDTEAQEPVDGGMVDIVPLWKWLLES